MDRPTTMTDISVLVVDDERAIAECLALAIRFQAGFASLGCALTFPAATRRMTETTVDVALVTLGVGGVNGLDWVRRLRNAHPSTSVVAIASTRDEISATMAAAAGAAECVSRDSGLSDVFSAVRRAHCSETRHRAVTKRPSGGQLAPREAEVLWLLARGSTVPLIAEGLFLSPHTVRGYLKSAFRRLGVHTQVEAVARARALGLIPSP